MISKNRFISLTLFLSTLSLAAQTSDNSSSGSEDVKYTYLIHVEESSDYEKYFPKLYPLGFIVKVKDEESKLTNYYLGDFSDDQEARVALKEVHYLGYRNAFIIQTYR